MKRNQIFAFFFGVLTVLLLCAMCATVAFHYAQMICAMNHYGASAPPSIAFLLAIPYLIGILISAGFGVFFFRKAYKK